MNVNLDYYKIFYYVAKYENFTRAAQALGNQSALRLSKSNELFGTTD